MSKLIITEERLNTLISESIEEVMLEEGWFRDTAGKAWNGIKNVAKNVRQGVKDSGGILPYASNLRGYAERRAEQLRNKMAQARKAGRAAADVKALQDPHPSNYWAQKYGEQFVSAMRSMLQSGNYPRERFIQALRAYNVSEDDIQKILANAGYNTADQSAGTTNNGELGVNPDVQQAQATQPQRQQQPTDTGAGNLGGGAGMDSAIEEAVSKAVKNFINEVGDTYKGQYKLGRLHGRRETQAFDANRKADATLDQDEYAKHKSQFSDYMNRATAAYVKARDERDAKGNSWEPHQRQMSNAFKHGSDKEDWKREMRDAREEGKREAERIKKEIKDIWKQAKEEAEKKKAERQAKKKNINEVGDTVKGQKQLGRLAGKRIKQSWVYSETGDEKKSEDYGKRYHAADRKAKEERDKTDSQNKRRRMINAYYKGADKGVTKK